MKGGAKLITKKDEGQLSGFEPVERMISSNSAVINLLTYSSLKGFMYRLKVSKHDTYYNRLGKGNMFNEPITDFILKLVVIRDSADENVGTYYHQVKTSESNESFFEESKLQMKIWEKSITGGFPEICPSVANLALFNNADSIKFMYCIFQKYKEVNFMEPNILPWIIEILKTDPINKIGVLLMPTIANSETFWDFINDPNNAVVSSSPQSVTQNRTHKMVYYLAAQVVRLFIVCKTIHFDLHENNSLIKNKNESIIIDFGRASDLENSRNDDYITAVEKHTILDHANAFYEELIGNEKGKTIDSFNTQAKKNNYMLRVINYIYDLDVVKNRIMFGTGTIQMKGWVDRIVPNKLYKAFDILKTLVSTSVVRRPTSTILKSKKHGEIINLDNITNFKVPFNCNIQQHSITPNVSPNENMVGTIIKRGKQLFFCIAATAATAGACYLIANGSSFLGKSGGTSKYKNKNKRSKTKKRTK